MRKRAALIVSLRPMSDVEYADYLPRLAEGYAQERAESFQATVEEECAKAVFLVSA